MPKYPSEIFEPREKENKTGVIYDPSKKSVIFAEDLSQSDAEIVAIQTELGTEPKGTHATVRERLEALEVGPDPVLIEQIQRNLWRLNANLWTIRTSAADNAWTSVTWSPELKLFVAVSGSGIGNRVMTTQPF